MRTKLTLTILLLLVLSGVCFAYTLESFTVSPSGGQNLSSPNYKMELDLKGQPAVGKSSSTNYQLELGGLDGLLAEAVVKEEGVPWGTVPLMIARIESGQPDLAGDIKVSWPAEYGAKINLLVLAGNFTPTPANWDPASGIEDHSTEYYVLDKGKAGANSAEPQKYYRALQQGVTKSTLNPDGKNCLETAPAVGKFDVTVTPGINLLSNPFISKNTALAAILGSQVKGASVPNYADKVKVFRPDKGGFYQAWLNTSAGNQWHKIEGGESNIIISSTEGFWVEVAAGHTPSVITFVGKVPDSNQTLSITQGLNLVSSNYPVPVALAKCGLWESGAANQSAPQYSCMVKGFKNDKSGFNQAWLSVDKTWKKIDGSAAEMEFMPGKGYWISAPAGNNFNWNYPKPY